MKDVLPPHVVFKRTQDGGVLLNKVTGVYSQVNSTAADVLDGVALGKSRLEIAGGISSKFAPVDADAVQADVDDLLRQLHAIGVIVGE